MKNDLAPTGCTNLKLRQLNRLVTRHYDGYVAGSGLKNTQYALLSHVLKLGPIRPSDLAKIMQMDASTLTRNMQPLVVQGWVAIGAGEDARSRLVQITEAGAAKRADGYQAWKKAQSALTERLGVSQVVALHSLLDACLTQLDDGSDERPARAKE